MELTAGRWISVGLFQLLVAYLVFAIPKAGAIGAE
jgi:hypothetical protein